MWSSFRYCQGATGGRTAPLKRRRALVGAAGSAALRPAPVSGTSGRGALRPDLAEQIDHSQRLY
jgi:hypothetical protein